MQDGTYPSRNFATLGPSELRPPFTGIFYFNQKIIYITALGRCQILCLLLKYRILCFYETVATPLIIIPIGSFYSEVTKSICRVPSLLLFFLSIIIIKLTCVRLTQFKYTLCNIFIYYYK